MWCVADLTDDYLEKMEEVLEVYERPYNPAEPVVFLDEKPVTLHDDVRPARPMAPGKPRRPDNEYKRCGTANVFCAVERKAGNTSRWQLQTALLPNWLRRWKASSPTIPEPTRSIWSWII